ncbi:hypothetical protein [Vibrio phage phiKT1028]|nr:hypothetical protein [Vibrio phage phiKT1028]
MYFIDTKQIVDNLLTFDQLDYSRVDMRPYASIIVEDIITMFNSKTEENLYDRIGHLTSTIGNNIAVETIYLSILNGLKDHCHKCGWDNRIMVKLNDHFTRDHSGEITQLIIVMDLDATMEACYDPYNPTTSLGEMISDNPTPDQMSNFIPT